ncbi:hypothetical protein L596_026120 [Steinernema carpocapsae]|uniref:Uncharacterized protein n=1 Tax=Steinernema carpocapsae TaxID=34508 RepID=A0A4U5M0E4_STECR|nr:hypothetical protein L596_026120 [Steinernema carpocapsae]
MNGDAEGSRWPKANLFYTTKTRGRHGRVAVPVAAGQVIDASELTSITHSPPKRKRLRKAKNGSFTCSQGRAA